MLRCRADPEDLRVIYEGYAATGVGAPFYEHSHEVLLTRVRRACCLAGPGLAGYDIGARKMSIGLIRTGFVVGVLVAAAIPTAWWLSRSQDSLPDTLPTRPSAPVSEIAEPPTDSQVPSPPMEIKTFEPPVISANKEVELSPALPAYPKSQAKLIKRVAKLLDGEVPKEFVVELLPEKLVAELFAEVDKAERRMRSAHHSYSQEAFRVGMQAYNDGRATKFTSETISEPDPHNPGSSRTRVTSPYDSKQADEFIVERGVAGPNGTVENHVVRLRPNDSADYADVWFRYSVQSQTIQNELRSYLNSLMERR